MMRIKNLIQLVIGHVVISKNMKTGKIYKVLNPDTNRWVKMMYVQYHWLYGEVFVSPKGKKKYLFVDEKEIKEQVKAI